MDPAKGYKKMITKVELDKLAEKYETKEFFYDDPIGIPNRFKDKKDKGWAVLNSACHSGSMELVQWLVEHGANVNAKNIKGETVLHSAAYSGNMELVQWLIERGANVKAKDKERNTVVTYAEWSGNLELVHWLLEQGLK